MNTLRRNVRWRRGGVTTTTTGGDTAVVAATAAATVAVAATAAGAPEKQGDGSLDVAVASSQRASRGASLEAHRHQHRNVWVATAAIVPALVPVAASVPAAATAPVGPIQRRTVGRSTASVE